MRKVNRSFFINGAIVVMELLSLGCMDDSKQDLQHSDATDTSASSTNTSTDTFWGSGEDGQRTDTAVQSVDSGEGESSSASDLFEPETEQEVEQKTEGQEEQSTEGQSTEGQDGQETEEQEGQEGEGTDLSSSDEYNERFYHADSFVMNLDLEMINEQECYSCDDWAGRLQAILKREGETLEGSICAVSQSHTNESAGACTNIAGKINTDGLTLDAFSLPYLGHIEQIAFEAFTITENQDGTLTGTCRATQHLLFDDIMSMSALSGELRASEDAFPASALIHAESLHGLEPIAVYFTEPISCENIGVSITSGDVDFSDAITMACEEDFLGGLTRHITITPNSFWREGSTSIVVSNLVDAAGNSTATWSVSVDTTMPNTKENFGFELGEGMDGWIATSCFAVSEFQNVYDTSERVVPPEGAFMALCSVGGRLLGRITTNVEATQVSISLWAKTLLTFDEVDLIKFELMSEKGRVPMMLDAETGRYTATVDMLDSESRDVWVEIVNNGVYTEGGNGTVVLVDDIQVID